MTDASGPARVLVAPAAASWARFRGNPMADVVSRLFEEFAVQRVDEDLDVLLREPPPEALLLELAGRLAGGPRTEAELGALADHSIRPWFEDASNRDRLRDGVRAAAGPALRGSFWIDFHARHIQPSVVGPAADPLRRYPLRDAAWDKVSGQVLAILQDRCVERRDNWLRDAVDPLVVALEQGILGVGGVREPVGDRGKPPEPVPFGVLEDRRWRLQRDQSRFVAFDTAGTPQDAFKHAVLDVRAEAEPGAMDPAAARVPPEPGGPAPQELAFELYGADPVGFVRQFMLDLPNGMSTGSRATARAIRDQHPGLAALKELEQHADEARGHKLEAHRVAGLPKGEPKLSRR